MMMIMMRLSVAILSFMAAALILTSSSADRHDGIERALAAFRQEGSQHWAILSCAAGLRLRQPSGRITRSHVNVYSIRPPQSASSKKKGSMRSR